MYAIIESGGKQYRVEKGDIIKVEKLDAEVGSKVTFEDVLFIGDKTIKVGNPTIKGAKVTGKVVSIGREKKVIVYKYKPKKGFHKKNGHKQFYTEVVIDDIKKSSRSTKKAEGEAAEATEE